MLFHLELLVRGLANGFVYLMLEKAAFSIRLMFTQGYGHSGSF